jgi:uncharacterized coiled-coil protein SlyX
MTQPVNLATATDINTLRDALQAAIDVQNQARADDRVRISTLETQLATTQTQLSTATARITSLESTSASITFVDQAFALASDNITQLRGRVAGINVTLTDTAQRTVTLERTSQTQANNLSAVNSVVAQQGRNIMQLSSDTTAIKADLLSHNISLGLLNNNQTSLSSALQGQILTLAGRVSVTETYGPRLNTAQSDIVTLQSATGTNTADIANLNAQVCVCVPVCLCVPVFSCLRLRDAQAADMVALHADGQQGVDEQRDDPRLARHDGRNHLRHHHQPHCRQRPRDHAGEPEPQQPHQHA